AFDPAQRSVLAALLQDPEPRVRFFAALAWPRISRDCEPIFTLLRENADHDPFLRHAGVMALVGIKDANALAKAASSESAAIRMAVLVTLRRMENRDVARFLQDSDPRLVLEAARAINDTPIPGAFADLAGLITRPGLEPPLLHRVLHAHFL